ncbi:MAG TPA: phosphoglucosamine mutase [Candidatus Megaira endosymbiont of Hartmannula sinica]|nr:phosphoglucosamine mutase [Candidatus Megaera endosymbiont of Hartmannula sinica]
MVEVVWSIRGRSNRDIITPEFMTKIARAISAAVILNISGDDLSKNNIITSDILSNYSNRSTKKKIIIGKDTRLSGYMLEYALTAGFISMGIDVILAGPMPTAGIAMLVKSLRADGGIIISASHNPYYDNGIKVFNNQGFKISHQQQNQIEYIVKNIDLSSYNQSYDNIGKASKLGDEQGRYIEYIKSFFPKDLNMKGLKIVLDTANGAAYEIAPKVFSELGADIITINNSPNGVNINANCGVCCLDNLKQQVACYKADMGIAFDGDADRLIIIDEKGGIVDGDKIIGLIAEHMYKENILSSNKIITTVMSNTGLDQYLEKYNIEVIKTKVGDKHVISKMLETNSNLGGEKSGHVIIDNDIGSGDGLKTAIYMINIFLRKRKEQSIDYSNNLFKFSDLFKDFYLLPQINTNIEYDYKFFGKDIINQSLLEDIKKQLIDEYMNIISQDDYRIVLRPSGTENFIRLMIEIKDRKIGEMMQLTFKKIINKKLEQDNLVG